MIVLIEWLRNCLLLSSLRAGLPLPKRIHVQLIDRTISVTRLGYSWKVWVTKYLFCNNSPNILTLLGHLRSVTVWKNIMSLLFGQLLVNIWLLFIPSSGHTAGTINHSHRCHKHVHSSMSNQKREFHCNQVVKSSFVAKTRKWNKRGVNTREHSP